MLLALGVTPIIASENVRIGDSYLLEWGSDTLETFEFVSGENLPLEAIAASEPDLILAVGWQTGAGGINLEDNYQQLTAIAPVATSPSKTSKSPPWQESIRVIGTALDLADAAEQVITRDAQFFSQLRADNPNFAELTTTWGLWYGRSWGPLSYWSAPGTNVEKFVSELGFKSNAGAANFADDNTVSDEILSSIDADVLIIAQASADDDIATLTEQELFQNLGAVRSGRFVTFRTTDEAGNLPYAIAVNGPISRQWAADQIVPLIRAVL